MKKLMLYSDQVPALRQTADEALIKLIGKKKAKIGYIPSSADTSRRYFNDRKAFYRGLGMELVEYFELDVDWKPEKLPKLLACDAIHLSGGNTYYFLHWLRQRKMMDVLTRYVAGGGVLIGVSAGSILMTPDISTSSFPGDEVLPEDNNHTGLKLVDFAFVPHFGSHHFTLDDLKKYAREKKTVVYTAKDSGAILVYNDEIQCIGDVTKVG
jgi:dipeptidase E